MLGINPKDGRPVLVKIGRFGPVVQMGTAEDKEKPQFAQIPKDKSIETITLEEALALFKLPRVVGQFEGHDVIVSIGKFGPYVRLDNKFYSLSKNDDPYEVDLDRCIQIIKIKREIEREKERLRQFFPHLIGHYKELPVYSNIGRYGPYLTFQNENFRLPKDIDVEALTLDEAVEIIENTGAKKPRGRKKKTTEK
jgi:DNA topoisomerase-1